MNQSNVKWGATLTCFLLMTACAKPAEKGGSNADDAATEACLVGTWGAEFGDLDKITLIQSNSEGKQLIFASDGTGSIIEPSEGSQTTQTTTVIPMTWNVSGGVLSIPFSIETGDAGEDPQPTAGRYTTPILCADGKASTLVLSGGDQETFDGVWIQSEKFRIYATTSDTETLFAEWDTTLNLDTKLYTRNIRIDQNLNGEFEDIEGDADEVGSLEVSFGSWSLDITAKTFSLTFTEDGEPESGPYIISGDKVGFFAFSKIETVSQ
jgi:hypothetical protein